MTKHKFAAFDIDGTLFRSGLYREVVYELIRMKALPKRILMELSEQESAWQKRTHGNAFKEFEQAQADLLDAHLPKLKVKDFEAAAKSVIKNQKDNVYVYTRELSKKLKKDGYTLIAISGSQVELVEPFAKHYNFDIWVAQHHLRDGEYFTGESIKTHKGKDNIIRKLLPVHNLTLEGSIGIGDSRGDIGMLSLTHNSIAFNPDDHLFEAAQENNWKIVVERKNMIYELERNGSKQCYNLAASHTHDNALRNDG